MSCRTLWWRYKEDKWQEWSCCWWTMALVQDMVYYHRREMYYYRKETNCARVMRVNWQQ